MSQQVKLSDALVLEARSTAKLARRSLSGQIEFWMSLGKAVEEVLANSGAASFRRKVTPSLITARLKAVDTPQGRRRLARHLKSRPYPQFESISGKTGRYVRVDQNGKKARGRILEREFVSDSSGD